MSDVIAGPHPWTGTLLDPSAPQPVPVGTLIRTAPPERPPRHWLVWPDGRLRPPAGLEEADPQSVAAYIDEPAMAHFTRELDARQVAAADGAGEPDAALADIVTSWTPTCSGAARGAPGRHAEPRRDRRAPAAAAPANVSSCADGSENHWNPHRRDHPPRTRENAARSRDPQAPARNLRQNRDRAAHAPPPPRPRWLERSHIADVLAQLMPGSKTVVRLRLMHWTGMRPSQMARVQPDDFRLDEPTPFVIVPRGKGGRLAAIPLVGEGLDAARDFMAIRAYGRWSCPSANKALERAAGKAGRPVFTVYQIRHSFATGLRRTGSDVADIQDLYGHTDPETTMIYAPPQLQKHAAAIARLERADRAPAPVPPAIRLAESAGSFRESSVNC